MSSFSVANIIDPNGVFSAIKPTRLSKIRDFEILSFIRSIVLQLSPNAEVFMFGSRPLDVYLPGGDLDIGVISNVTVKGKSCLLLDELVNILRKTAYNLMSNRSISGPPFSSISHIHIVPSSIRVLKFQVDWCDVDVTVNTLGGLAAVCFLQRLNTVIGRNDLFKRSILLVKAWFLREGRLIASNRYLLSSYSVELLVLFIINFFYCDLSSVMLSKSSFSTSHDNCMTNLSSPTPYNHSGHYDSIFTGSQFYHTYPLPPYLPHLSSTKPHATIPQSSIRCNNINSSTSTSIPSTSTSSGNISSSTTTSNTNIPVDALPLTPFTVLYKLLHFLSYFDSQNYSITLAGPIPLRHLWAIGHCSIDDLKTHYPTITSQFAYKHDHISQLDWVSTSYPSFILAQQQQQQTTVTSPQSPQTSSLYTNIPLLTSCELQTALFEACYVPLLAQSGLFVPQAAVNNKQSTTVVSSPTPVTTLPASAPTSTVSISSPPVSVPPAVKGTPTITIKESQQQQPSLGATMSNKDASQYNADFPVLGGDVGSRIGRTASKHKTTIPPATAATGASSTHTTSSSQTTGNAPHQTNNDSIITHTTTDDRNQPVLLAISPLPDTLTDDGQSTSDGSSLNDMSPSTAPVRHIATPGLAPIPSTSTSILHDVQTSKGLLFFPTPRHHTLVLTRPFVVLDPLDATNNTTKSVSFNTQPKMITVIRAGYMLFTEFWKHVVAIDEIARTFPSSPPPPPSSNTTTTGSVVDTTTPTTDNAPTTTTTTTSSSSSSGSLQDDILVSPLSSPETNVSTATPPTTTAAPEQPSSVDGDDDKDTKNQSQESDIIYNTNVPLFSNDTLYKVQQLVIRVLSQSPYIYDCIALQLAHNPTINSLPSKHPLCLALAINDTLQFLYNLSIECHNTNNTKATTIDDDGDVDTSSSSHCQNRPDSSHSVDGGKRNNNTTTNSNIDRSSPLTTPSNPDTSPQLIPVPALSTSASMAEVEGSSSTPTTELPRLSHRRSNSSGALSPYSAWVKAADMEMASYQVKSSSASSSASQQHYSHNGILSVHDNNNNSHSNTTTASHITALTQYQSTDDYRLLYGLLVNYALCRYTLLSLFSYSLHDYSLKDLIIISWLLPQHCRSMLHAWALEKCQSNTSEKAGPTSSNTTSSSSSSTTNAASSASTSNTNAAGQSASSISQDSLGVLAHPITSLITLDGDILPSAHTTPIIPPSSSNGNKGQHQQLSSQQQSQQQQQQHHQPTYTASYTLHDLFSSCDPIYHNVGQFLSPNTSLSIDDMTFNHTHVVFLESTSPFVQSPEVNINNGFISSSLRQNTLDTDSNGHIITTHEQNTNNNDTSSSSSSSQDDTQSENIAVANDNDEQKQSMDKTSPVDNGIVAIPSPSSHGTDSPAVYHTYSLLDSRRLYSRLTGLSQYTSHVAHTLLPNPTMSHTLPHTEGMYQRFTTQTQPSSSSSSSSRGGAHSKDLEVLLRRLTGNTTQSSSSPGDISSGHQSPAQSTTGGVNTSSSSSMQSSSRTQPSSSSSSSSSSAFTPSAALYVPPHIARASNKQQQHLASSSTPHIGGNTTNQRDNQSSSSSVSGTVNSTPTSSSTTTIAGTTTAIVNNVDNDDTHHNLYNNPIIDIALTSINATAQAHVSPFVFLPLDNILDDTSLCTTTTPLASSTAIISDKTTTATTVGANTNSSRTTSQQQQHDKASTSTIIHPHNDPSLIIYHNSYDHVDNITPTTNIAASTPRTTTTINAPTSTPIKPVSAVSIPPPPILSAPSSYTPSLSSSSLLSPTTPTTGTGSTSASVVYGKYGNILSHHNTSYISSLYTHIDPTHTSMNISRDVIVQQLYTAQRLLLSLTDITDSPHILEPINNSNSNNNNNNNTGSNLQGGSKRFHRSGNNNHDSSSSTSLRHTSSTTGGNNSYRNASSSTTASSSLYPNTATNNNNNNSTSSMSTSVSFIPSTSTPQQTVIIQPSATVASTTAASSNAANTTTTTTAPTNDSNTTTSSLPSLVSPVAATATAGGGGTNESATTTSSQPSSSSSSITTGSSTTAAATVASSSSSSSNASKLPTGSLTSNASHNNNSKGQHNNNSSSSSNTGKDNNTANTRRHQNAQNQGDNTTSTTTTTNSSSSSSTSTSLGRSHSTAAHHNNTKDAKNTANNNNNNNNNHNNDNKHDNKHDNNNKQQQQRSNNNHSSSSSSVASSSVASSSSNTTTNTATTQTTNTSKKKKGGNNHNNNNNNRK